MTPIFRAFFASVSLSLLGVSAVSPAFAGSPVIEQAQQDGKVGERIDGYLGLVDPDVDDSIRRRVNEINAQRRTLYGRLASEAGVPIEQVARLTGEKQIARAAPGEFFMGEDGRWTKK